MTSNDELYLSYLCDQILVACNRIHTKLDKYDEFLLSYPTPVTSYHEQPSWHVATDVVQPRPPPEPPNGQPELYHHQFSPYPAAQPPLPPPPFIAQQRRQTCWDPPSSRMLPEFPQYDQPPTRPNSCWDPPDGHALYHQHGYQNWQPSSPPEYPNPRSGFMTPDYYSPPVGQQPCTGKLPLGWPQPPPQHSPSCWCPTAAPLPTATVPISTPANGFVEVQHLPLPLQYAQFQIFAEPISDSSDVEMPIMEEVRTKELPPIVVIEEHDGSINFVDGFDYSTEKILDSSAGLCGVEKAEKEKKPSQDHKREEEQVQGQFECSMQLNAFPIKVLQAKVDLGNSMGDNASMELLSDSSHVKNAANMNHRSTSLSADARLIPPLNDTLCLVIHGRIHKILELKCHVNKGHPFVIFDGNNEGSFSIIRRAFDPGGVISPKLVFSTLFIVSWFPP